MRHKGKHELLDVQSYLEMRHRAKHEAKHELLDEIFSEGARRMPGIALDFDAIRILRLDSSAWSYLEQHPDETFVFTNLILHDGFRFRAICTMEL